MMLADLYGKPLAETPEKTAIVFKDRSLTYAQLDEMVRRYIAALAHLGVGLGDRVALFMGNRPEFFALEFACFSLGAVCVPLNARFQTDEVVQACEKSSVSVLIADVERCERVGDVPGRVESLRHLFVLDDEAAAGDAVTDDGRTGGAASRDAGGPAAATADRSWAAAVAAAPATDVAPPPEDPAHPALVMFTSGSTGKPKGVVHTHGSIIATAESRIGTQRLTADDVGLVCTHICHCAGSLGVALPHFAVGAGIVLLEAFDPGDWLAAAAEHRPTRSLLLPPQLLDVLEHERGRSVDLSSFKEIVVAGGNVSHDLYRLFEEITGSHLQEAYGLTECEGACLPRYYDPAGPGTVGRPRVGVEIRVVDADGNDVEPGTPGEVWLQSDSASVGYWDDPEHTSQTIVDGWLRTGDLMVARPDGVLEFVGRIKELIIKGGSNVSPGEVEQVLDEHPAVEDSAVVGAPDARLGEVIHAFVELEPDAPDGFGEEELRAYAEQKLAAYKVPDRWTFLPELPRNDLDKLDMVTLHKMAEAAAD
jgi:acyl-CoA synthetase (AMP-forming)/AMP-acid ligase II